MLPHGLRSVSEAQLRQFTHHSQHAKVCVGRRRLCRDTTSENFSKIQVKPESCDEQLQYGRQYGGAKGACHGRRLKVDILAFRFHLAEEMIGIEVQDKGLGSSRCRRNGGGACAIAGGGGGGGGAAAADHVLTVR